MADYQWVHRFDDLLYCARDIAAEGAGGGELSHSRPLSDAEVQFRLLLVHPYATGCANISRGKRLRALSPTRRKSCGINFPTSATGSANYGESDAVPPTADFLNRMPSAC